MDVVSDLERLGYAKFPIALPPQHELIAEAVPLRLNAALDVFLIRTEDSEGFRLTTVTNPHLVSTMLRAITNKLLGMVSEWFAASTTIEGTYLITKDSPRGLDVPPHQDAALCAYRSIRNGRRISSWLPLQPTGKENGGLFIHAGSHQFGLIAHSAIKRTLGFVQKFVPNENIPVTGNPAHMVDCEYGECLLLDDRVIHGSNRTEQASPRRAFIVDFLVGET